MELEREYIFSCAKKIVDEARVTFRDFPEKGSFESIYAWEKNISTPFQNPLGFEAELAPLFSSTDKRCIKAEVVNINTGYKAVRILFSGKKNEILGYLQSIQFEEELFEAFLRLKEVALE